MPVERKLCIHLMGRFRVTSEDGADCTPTSAKGQALVALLATSPNLERGRAWVQAKLWSDRSFEQGSRSLRQELSQLRKRLGEDADALMANRKSLSLADELVDVRDYPDVKTAEFLEGLDLRDNEFNHWLSVERSKRSTNSLTVPAYSANRLDMAHTKEACLCIVGQSAPGASCQVLEVQFIDAAAKSLRDIADVDVQRSPTKTNNPCALVVTVQVFQVPGRIANLRVTVERSSDLATLWSQTITVGESPDGVDLDLECLRLINRLFEEVCVHLGKSVQGALGTPEALASLAIMKGFSINKNDLDDALHLLEQAYELDPRGVFLAWQAQILAIQMVERYQDDLLVLRERGDELCREAIRLDPTNANVLAASANFTTIVERNETGGFELARLAVRANPANPLAWWALSNAVQYHGDQEKAYSAALRAHNLSTGTRLEFWSAFQRALTAMLNGRHGEAVRFGELSGALQQQFRPPLRYLGALYSQVEKSNRANQAFSSLKALEPDFSLDRLINDPDYPVKLMRSQGLINAEMITKLTI